MVPDCPLTSKWVLYQCFQSSLQYWVWTEVNLMVDLWYLIAHWPPSGYCISVFNPCYSERKLFNNSTDISCLSLPWHEKHTESPSQQSSYQESSADMYAVILHWPSCCSVWFHSCPELSSSLTELPLSLFSFMSWTLFYPDIVTTQFVFIHVLNSFTLTE